jgi:DNA-directed RNA polymerase subunit beta'
MSDTFPVVGDPQSSFDTLRRRTEEAIKGLFPIIGQRNILELETIGLSNDPGIRDVKSQLDARLNDGTWGSQIVGRMVLRDASTGKVKSRGQVPLAILPKPTAARGYIVDGKEYYVDHLWKTKPGVYTFPKARGVTAQIVTEDRGLSVDLDPKSREFKLRVGGSTLALKPVLNALGVSNAQIAKAWGEDIHRANDLTERRSQTSLDKFQRSLKAGSISEARDLLQQVKLDPEVMKKNLGKAYKNITPEMLLETSKKILAVSRGKAEPDDRDALRYKDLIGIDDYVANSIQAFGKVKARSLRNMVDRNDDVKLAVRPNAFHWPIRGFFSRSALSQLGEQTNPVDMMRASTRSTILGEGGSLQALEGGQAKSVHASHVGYIDPMDTPEGAKVGVNLQLALGTMKVGTTPMSLLWNRRTKKIEPVDPTTFETAVVAMPDQYRWKGKSPTPVGKKVRVSGLSNKFMRVDADKVDYIIPNSNMLLGMGSNLVPFIQNTSAGRIEMADRHLAQAIPLTAREAPLVQVSFGPEATQTMEEAFALDHLPTAPAAGRVTSVKGDEIRIKTQSGKMHTIQLYKNYPLTGKRELLDETSIVKVGDKVKSGQALADSVFTKGGVLALGTNLRVGLIPMPGRTFEDAIVVSEGAAKKLTSEHLHKIHATPDDQEISAPKRYQAYYPTAYTAEQLKSIDENGVVKPGTVLKPGDPVVLGLRPQEHTNEALAMKRMHRSLAKPYHDAAISWDQDNAGEVVRVHKTPDGTVKVHVRTLEQLEVGDKITTRHGVKGVIVDIRPDAEMPQVKDGPIEIALNPHGIASRMAVGQIYEMAAAKAAKAKGEPVKVANFLPDTDYGEMTREAMTKLNLPLEEDVTDPITGKMLGKAAVGYTYVLKQRHQVDRKMAARVGGPGYSYDVNRQPKSGGSGAGQSLGGLGNLALLAHGSREILREAHTWKMDADQSDQLWRAIQLGQPLPPPKLTFAHKKFGEYLKAMGLQMEKKGTRVRLTPFIDKEILESSHGEIERPGLMLRASDLKPEKGGLFDPQVTGGIQGDHPGHITLAESIPNPVFERGVLALTGLKNTEMQDVLAGKMGISKEGKLVDRKEKGAITGSKAIAGVLKNIDVTGGIKELKSQIPDLSGQALDRAVKKYRYLTALKQTDLRPDEAYMTKHVYVLPPSMRPMSVLPSGALVRDSLNELYKGVGIINERIKEMDPETPEGRKGRVRLSLYNAVGSLTGVMDAGKTVQGAEMRGALSAIVGPTSPKYGFFQQKLLKGKQDLSARSAIVPDPDLSIDEIGVPKPLAEVIYRPFVVRELTKLGYGALEGQEMAKENDPLALKALEKVMLDRPVIMKRDPVLHKYGVQAFRAKLIGGRSIRIPPLITESMNADFDGDTVSLYVPVSTKAMEESKKMFPSESLLNPATGKPVFTPRNETAVGLYRLSEFGKDSGKSFKDPMEAARQAAEQKLDLTDVIHFNGKKTTVGRLLISNALPAAVRNDAILHDPDYEFTTDNVKSLLSATAKVDKKGYAKSAQTLMHLGNAAVYDRMFSLSLDDFKTDKKLRDQYMNAAEKAARTLLASDNPDREAKAVEVWADAGKKMMLEHEKNAKASGNKLLLMSRSGVKPNPHQFQEMTMAPILMMDSRGVPILEPVTKSYGEGLDAAGYWMAAVGARTGLVQTANAVKVPGYINKQLANTISNQVVVSDKLPEQGITMDLDHPDVVDRYLVEPVKTSKLNLRRGTLLTADLVDRLKNGKVGRVVVASPLTSPHGEGISSKSYGVMPDGRLPEIGDNLGIMAGQAIGERTAQLMISSKHTGGVVGSSRALTPQTIERVKELLRLPEDIKDPATLATVDGKISSIKEDPAGGWNVTVGTAGGGHIDHYISGQRKLSENLKIGSAVRKGRPITDGNIDMRELLDIGGLDQVRNQMVTELDGIFRPFGIRRRNLEVMVRGVTNTGIISDSGDSPDMVKGQAVAISAINELNQTELKGKKPVKVTPVLSGIGSAPLDNTEDWIAKMNHERLRDSVLEAALQGHVSDISGYNPFSSMAMNERFGLGISGKPGAY